ncbi:uncharacterized protein LOC142355111 [Convolutriloba macropyga]|uniref:uncharacterized protein LOC142355111 n=1 Tax=Convolutriloba macropyga TaxID=536237 RepID=UPI003F51DFCA
MTHSTLILTIIYLFSLVSLTISYDSCEIDEVECKLYVTSNNVTDYIDLKGYPFGLTSRRSADGRIYLYMPCGVLTNTPACQGAKACQAEANYYYPVGTMQGAVST